MTDRSTLQLVIEASTTVGSVALIRGGAVLDVRQVTMGSGAADVLFPAMVSLCEEADVTPSALARIVCGEGPGSFTSLRIAAALAKGLAHGGGVPLAAVSSLLMAGASTLQALPTGRYAVHADALRGERYVQWMEVRTSDVMALGPAQRMSVAQLQALTTEANRLGVLSAPAELTGAVVTPNALGFLRIAPAAIVDVPVATWEPLYGRLAEAQVQWEQRHGEPLPVVPLASI